MGIDWEDILDAEAEYLADVYESDEYDGDLYKTADKSAKEYEAYEADTAEASRYKHVDRKVYCVGTWRGTTVKFKKKFSNHTFTKKECAKLLADEVIEFPAKTKDGKMYTAKGKLDYSTHKGRTCVRFNFINQKNYCTGTWQGTNVLFKKTFRNHTFTEEECAKLLAEEVIEFPVTAKDGKEHTIKGKLENLGSSDSTYVGIKVIK